MFSKLRPHHKRSGSTPSSPTPHSIQTSNFLQPPNSSHGPGSATSPSSAESPNPSTFFFKHIPDAPIGNSPSHHQESPISPYPPSLPPIPRIASVYGQVQQKQRVQQPVVEEHGYELRKERTPEWQENAFPSNSWERDDEMRPPQPLTFTRQEQRPHYDFAEERPQSAGTRPQTSGEASGNWHYEQSTYAQVGAVEYESRNTSLYQNTQISFSSSQGLRRPLEMASPPPPAPLPKDEYHQYSRQSSVQPGSQRPYDMASLPPVPLPKDENQTYSRQSSMQFGHQLRQHEVHSPPPVPLSNDAHQVYSRQPVMQLGNLNGSRQSLGQSSQQKSERQGKNKFHLLNPMSLLSRRRNGQELEQLSEESLISHKNPSVSPLPDGYDPSIRGKVFHDFDKKKPPPRKFSNSSGSTLVERTETRELSSRDGIEPGRPRKGSDDTFHQQRQSQHTPVFKEHFDDDPDEKTNASAINAESLANKDFLARNSFPPAEQDSPLSPLPPFARTAKTVYKPEQQQQQQSLSQLLPQSQPQPLQTRLAPPVQPHEAYVGSSVTAAQLSPLMEDPVSPLVSPLEEDEQNVNINVNTTGRNISARKPPSARSRIGSRTSFGSDFQSAGLPSHMLSRASRFSFQYANTDSAAQEKLLEEKHRQKAAAKALARMDREAEEDQSEEEEDEMDYDDMDYDDMDDDVPMVGEDWDYGGGGIGMGLSNMTLNNLPLNGMMMGMNGLSMQEAAQMALRGNPVSEFTDMPTGPVQGLGILPSIEDEEAELEMGAEQDLVSPLELPPVSMKLPRNEPPPVSMKLPEQAADGAMTQDDNFYFDDGEFDDADFAETDTQKFDESVLDDPSHPLYERQPVQPPPPIPAKSLRRMVPQNSQKLSGQRTSFPSEPVPALPEHPDPSASFDVINKYQSALAQAATKAAAEGRFKRSDSIGNSSSDIPLVPNETHDEEETFSSQPSLIPDDGRYSQATTMSPPTARASEVHENPTDSTPSKNVGFLFPGTFNDDLYSSDFDYSDYDSAMEDDPIIAAANAEALANDDEGIYGSEFGFYARPGAADTQSADGTSVYGGYFGPKDWGEIKRQRSTREPNLTPITERSEYSTRNSYISLHPGERNDRGAPSPSLTTLAQMSPGWDDMNMETLMKLRRGAFGGSQRSTSSRGDNGSSPMNSSSPVVPKSDPRALWSSPISRELPTQEPEQDADDDGDYEDLIGEANYGGHEGFSRGGYEDEWEDASDTSSAYDNDEGANDSPTIRAAGRTLRGSPSPTNRLPSPAFSEYSQQHQQRQQQQPPQLLTPASTASTNSTSQTALTTPIPLSHSTFPVFSTSSRPTSLGPVSPTSPQKITHNRSGSDSVAYVRERDEDGGQFRWVLERRRTGEDGVESLVGRTLVEGGRI